jgi:hypothetical protein
MIVHEFAVVDDETFQVIGKYISTFSPSSMVNINYKLTLPDDTEVTGTAFLSKSGKYWNEVKSTLYLVENGREHLQMELSW